jgi:hypothetical protein
MQQTLTEIELIYDWVDSCPAACQSYVDDNGNIIVTVETNEQES